MAALVAPGIARYAVHGTYSGRPVVNILDFKLDTTGSSFNRSDVLRYQAKRIIDAWVHHICEYLIVDNYMCTEVSWIDLDSLTGEVGSETAGNDEDLPAPGVGAGPAMPGNVATRINKQTSAGRGSRQGRMYLVGVNESQTSDANPNSIESANITSGNDLLETFLTEITAEQELPHLWDWTSQLHVVHTVDGVFASSSEVTSLTIDPVLGSQRRRLRG